MGDDTGHLVVGACPGEHPVLGCNPLPLPHSGRGISSKEIFQKKNTNNYTRNNGILCFDVLWFFCYLSAIFTGAMRYGIL